MLAYSAIGILILSILIQGYFWVVQLGALTRHTKDAVVSNNDSLSLLPSVGVLIAFKNELPQLKKYVSLLLDQDYVNYILYYIDDHSDDDGLQFLEALNNEKIKLIRQVKGKAGKKDAISLGISKVKEDWILCTDADCFPDSKQWISSMMRRTKEVDMVLGYGPSIGRDGSHGHWLARWISFETWFIAIQYFSAALLKRPYMGVGRNIAYRKSLFAEIGGFEAHEHIKSGDDDLFISQLKSTHRLGLSLDRKSWMWSASKGTLRAYIRQKRRHLSTAPHYKLRTKVWLSMVFMSQLFWYVAVLFLCIKGFWILALGLILLRLVLLSFVSFKKPLQREGGIINLAVNDVLLCIFYLTLSFAFVFPQKEW